MDAVRFGEGFELDPGAYVLRRSGEALKLERIPMEILLLLTEHRGQLVTREQIVERVWGKGVHLDADNSINGAIRKIRQVLHDDPEHPHFIRTVTGRGYRFTAPVAPLHPPSSVTQSAPAPRPAPERRSRRRLWIASSLALLILVAAGGVVMTRGRNAPPQRVMVAVLPFDNLTGDVKQEYFSDGLTDAMITQLGERDPQYLGVIARASVMHYKTSRAPLEQIARELGVQYLLEGGVRRDANQFRITAQLIRARDQTQVWSRQYDRPPADLLTLQDEIAQAIANEIQSSLGGDGSRRGAPAASDASAATPAFAAYDLFLRGEYALNKRTVPDLKTAIRYFKAAVAKDTSYARAYAALANSYSLLAGYSALPPKAIYAKARAAGVKALALDSLLPEAHTAFALIVQNSGLDWQTAEREFRRAIELNPNYATAHHWYAEQLMWRGRFDEALRESERARQLDPLSLIIAADNGAILFYARQYDRAIAKWQSILELDPEFPRAHLIISAYIEKGMYVEALADVERRRPVLTAPVYWSELASIYGRAGRVAEARAALGKLLQSAGHQTVQASYLAGAYSGLRDTAQTITWLERAYAEHPSELVTLKVEPAWDFARGQLRFKRLLERTGLSN
jgi:TolB-like protein/DNA-binding winged helix-turn-helix (wHTH) protein/Flp pilus assembly protein TadD